MDTTSDEWQHYTMEFNSGSENKVWVNWAFNQGTFYVDDYIVVPKNSPEYADIKAGK